MASYKYLIVGAGMTADAAVRGIRELDPDGKIGLIGSDHNPPYNRPPLTKGLWKGKSLDSIWRGTQQFTVDLHLGRTVRSIDPVKKWSAMTRERNISMINYFWPRVAHLASYPSGRGISFTTAPWMITSTCAR